jgi:hypothetical protein
MICPLRTNECALLVVRGRALLRTVAHATRSCAQEISNALLSVTEKTHPSGGGPGHVNQQCHAALRAEGRRPVTTGLPGYPVPDAKRHSDLLCYLDVNHSGRAAHSFAAFARPAGSLCPTAQPWASISLRRRWQSAVTFSQTMEHPELSACVMICTSAIWRRLHAMWTFCRPHRLSTDGGSR